MKLTPMPPNLDRLTAGLQTQRRLAGARFVVPRSRGLMSPLVLRWGAFRLTLLVPVVPLLLCVGCGTALPSLRVEGPDSTTCSGVRLDGPGVSVDTGMARRGQASIRVTCDGLTHSVFHTEPMLLGASRDTPRRITVSVWVKAEGIEITHHGGWSAGRLMLHAHNAKGEEILTPDNHGFTHLGVGEMSGYFCGTFDWKELRGNFVVPPGTAAVTLEAGLSYARGTAWFASIQVQEVALRYSPREDASAIVAVDTETLNPLPVLGVGWNWAYVFERDSEMRMPRERIDQLLRYAAWDQQSFVRFGFLAEACLKEDSRRSAAQYDGTREAAKLYLQVLRGLQGLGATILACNWHYGDQSPYPDPPYPAERFADSVATVLKQWVGEEGLTGIRYASLWNEPDWWYRGGHYPHDFGAYWRALDQQLRIRGMRGSIGIVGADTTQGGSVAAQAFPRLDTVLDGGLDAFSAHDYVAAVEAPGETCGGGAMMPFLAGYRTAVAALGSKPLFLGEFGSGLRGDQATYRGTLSNAELVLGCLNAGVRGFARWAYNYPVGLDAGLMAPGFCPFLIEAGSLVPNRPVYYGYAVLTKAIRPGARVAPCRVAGGQDADGHTRVHAAALIGPTGAVAVVVVNDGATPKKIMLRGLPTQELYHYWYDSTLPDGLQGGVSVRVGKGPLVVKPMSINAFTAWQWDTLKP